MDKKPYSKLITRLASEKTGLNGFTKTAQILSLDNFKTAKEPVDVSALEFQDNISTSRKRIEAAIGNSISNSRHEWRIADQQGNHVIISDGRRADKKNSSFNEINPNMEYRWHVFASNKNIANNAINWLRLMGA